MPLPTLARGAALNLAARAATVLMGLAILVTVARLGPAVQGAFALFVAVEAALLTLFSGLGLLLAREVSHRHRAVGGLLRAALAWSAALGLVAGALLALAASQSDTEPYRRLWLLALAAPFILWVPTATGLWLGQGRMGPLNGPQVAAPALVLVGLGVFWLGQRGDSSTVDAVWWVLLCWVLAKSLVAVATAAMALRDAGPAAADASALRCEWRFVALIGATNLVSLMNYRATLFLVERQAGLAEAGVYSVAVQVAELLWLLSSALTVSAYHRIGSPDAAQAAATTVKVLRFNLLATAAAAPVLFLGAWWGLPWLLGPAYAGALLPLACLLPGVAAYAGASSLSAYYTNHRGRPQWSAGIAGLSLALTLAMALWSVPAFGAVGAALATSAAYAVAIVVGLRLFLRDAGLPWRALITGHAGAQPAATRQSDPA